MDEYDWLESFNPERLKGSIAINSIVPPVFNYYFIIEGCYGIIDKFPFDEYPDDTDSIEKLNKRHNIEREFNLFLNYESEELYRPLTIKEIAQHFNVGYSRNTLHHIKATPGIRYLYKRSIENLSRLVNALVTTSCYLYIEDIYRTDQEVFKDFTLKNDINSGEKYIRFLKQMGFDYCSYLFPVDQRWCLTSYEDVDCLILACDKNTIDVVNSIKGLETFEVFPETILNSK